MSLLTDTKEYFINSVSSVINETEGCAVPENTDFNLLYKLSSRNSMQTMLYFALNAQKDALPEDIFKKFQKSYQATVMRETAQQDMLTRIRNEFNKSDIDFMLLKGSHLKALYPQPEMRFMVDMDILVKKEDVEKAKQIILSYGLRQEMNNGKDIVFIKEPFITIELHNSLFVDDCYMYDYFCDVWQRAVCCDGCEYKMTYNDLYVYTLAHLAEHYLTAGSCMRPTVDIYLLNRKCADELDFKYINLQFEALKLEKFANNIKELGSCWFEEHEKNETLELMEKYIVFGAPVENSSTVAHAAKTNQSKFKMVLSSAFPNIKHMRLLYPVLSKAPFLLPLFWIVRIFKHLFTDKRIQQNLNSINSIDKQKEKLMKDIFSKSGLN